jgi:putative DNA primase/helicase
LTTGRDFLVEYISPHDCISAESLKTVREVLHFISDVLGTDDVVHSVLSSLCLSMHGESCLQKFFMWVGCGSNGKSKLANLFRASLGEYVCTIPVTVFTQKRIECGRPCPELQRTKGRRVVFISEPSHNENLNLGIVKEITGGDAMFARGLYEGGGEIQCRFTPVLLCNVLPNVTDTSHGAWRRLVAINFPTTFTDHPSPGIPHEKPLDTSIDLKIEKWADAFLTYLLTDGFPFYKGRGLTIPREVINTTKEYKEECDFYTEFFREKIVTSNVPTDRVSWPHVYSSFYSWFRDSVGLDHLPKKVEIRKTLERDHFKRKLKNGHWTGFTCPT